MADQPSKKSLEQEVELWTEACRNAEDEVEALRQKNAALVSALQDTRTVLANYCCQNPRWLYDGKDQDPSGAHALLEKVDEILALCAPAEDEAKEKP